jgi:hypothetical protein
MPIRSRIALALLILLIGAGEPARGQPAGAPQTCRIGVNIEELYDLDLAGDTFGAVLWLWSLCPSAQSAPLATIALPSGSNLDLGDLHSSWVEQAGYYQYRRIQGLFRHDWDMRHYPFDRQRLVIPIDDTDLGSSVVVFEPDIASSFLSAPIRTKLEEWDVSDPSLEASVIEPPSTYGLPDAQRVGYARIEATVVLERTQLLTFVKLTAGVRRADRSAVVVPGPARSGHLRQQARRAGRRSVRRPAQHARGRRVHRRRRAADACEQDPPRRVGADHGDRLDCAPRAAACRPWPARHTISGLAAGCRNRGALCPDQPRARDERRVALSVVAANRRSLERSERGCPELAAHLHRAYQGCGEVLQRP